MKSVVVRDRMGGIISRGLPEDFVFAMFLWQETDGTNGNDNNITIQLSHGEARGGPDIQITTRGYLVENQFFTGNGETYDQAGHRLNFTWLSGSIEWFTEAGGDQRRSITPQVHSYDNPRMRFVARH